MVIIMKRQNQKTVIIPVNKKQNLFDICNVFGSFRKTVPPFSSLHH